MSIITEPWKTKRPLVKGHVKLRKGPERNMLNESDILSADIAPLNQPLQGPPRKKENTSKKTYTGSEIYLKSCVNEDLLYLSFKYQ